jgi:hypothetical protein
MGGGVIDPLDDLQHQLRRPPADLHAWLLFLDACSRSSIHEKQSSVVASRQGPEERRADVMPTVITST